VAAVAADKTTPVGENFIIHTSLRFNHKKTRPNEENNAFYFHLVVVQHYDFRLPAEQNLKENDAFFETMEGEHRELFYVLLYLEVYFSLYGVTTDYRRTFWEIFFVTAHVVRGLYLTIE
jgi:hypothetical protein